MKLKKCCKCKKLLSQSEFYHNKSESDGYDGYCKKCRSDVNLKWRENNMEKWRKIYTKRHNIYKEKIKKLLGDSCKICGFKRSLISHEIYGKPHNNRLTYIIKHHKDFIRLCFWCHKSIHQLARNNKELALKLLQLA